MKISKNRKTVQANSDVLDEPVTDVVIGPIQEVATLPIECDYKELAVQAIYQAIDQLAHIAETDVQARESIANLSVVLFDLK